MPALVIGVFPHPVLGIKPEYSWRLSNQRRRKMSLVHTSQCYLWVNLKGVLDLNHAPLQNHCMLLFGWNKRKILSAVCSRMFHRQRTLKTLSALNTDKIWGKTSPRGWSSLFSVALREYAWMCFMNHDWLSYTKEQPFWVIQFKIITNYQWCHSINASFITVSVDGFVSFSFLFRKE